MMIHNFFNVHLLVLFVDKNAMVSPNFFNQNFSAVFEIFRKNEEINPLFSLTITILDYTLYGKVNIY